MAVADPRARDLTTAARGTDVEERRSMTARTLFRGRSEAGIKLGLQLSVHRHDAPLVLGLPRGGVLVAYEVARALDAPLDVCVVRKVGAPLEPEVAVGAVGEEGTVLLDREVMARLDIGEDELRRTIEAKRVAVEAEAARLRRGSPALAVRGRSVIVVDDGVATGGLDRAALQTLRARGAGAIVLAIPVGDSRRLDELAGLADEVVCLHCEEPVHAVSPWYAELAPATDAEVSALLERRRSELAAGTARAQRTAHASRLEAIERHVEIAIHRGNAQEAPSSLHGALALPPGAAGIIVCMHGVGGEHTVALERAVAGGLCAAGFATLSVDLLTEIEQRDAYAFDVAGGVSLLASRLLEVAAWARAHVPEARVLDMGYFGVAAGAAAALAAAAQAPELVRAIVSVAGRPDLAEEWLGDVRTPTLLVVGGLDGDALTVHRETLYFLHCESKLDVVHDATAYFEEPGAIARVVRSTQRWFRDHLREPGARALRAP